MFLLTVCPRPLHETILPPAFAYWREFGARYVTALCAIPEAGEGGAPIQVSELPQAELEQLALAAPLMTGAEYLTVDSLAALWRAMNAALGAELQEVGVGVQDFLKRRHPAWNLVGRVHFNLAENRNDAHAPFAFLATYTIRLAANARAQHVPLGQALRDYAGAANRDRLLSLLMPVQRAAERCPWLKAMVDGGDIYHPLRWSPQNAFQFLRDVPLLEGAGVVVRMPASWRMNRPAHPQVKATVGGKPPSQLGLEALLDFRMEVTLEGETLSPAEIRQLLAQSDGLAPYSRPMDRSRSRAAADTGTISGHRAGHQNGRSAVRRSNAPARRCWRLERCKYGSGRRGLERGYGRTVAGRNAGGPAPP